MINQYQGFKIELSGSQWIATHPQGEYTLEGSCGGLITAKEAIDRQIAWDAIEDFLADMQGDRKITSYEYQKLQGSVFVNLILN